MTVNNLDGLGGGFLKIVNSTDHDLGRGGLAESVSKFSEAMTRASAPQPIEGSFQVAQLTTVNDAAPAQNVQSIQQSAEARDRAATGLELNPEVETTGQSILSGLERLRGVFDMQYGTINGQVDGVQMDVGQMMVLQAEVVKYSVLVDVTSKLAGKSTQAMDSLMKGQ